MVERKGIELFLMCNPLPIYLFRLSIRDSVVGNSRLCGQRSVIFSL